MDLKNISQQLNLFSQCKKYGLPLWQCPQFLFTVMGIFIIVTTLITYAIGVRYVSNPQIIVLIVLLVTAILFIISFIITQSFEKLAEVSKLKTEFINIVSHQLRSPLTNVRWVVDLLISGELGRDEEKQKEFFTILKENSDRMEELISDLLTVSRMESERTLPKKTFFSLEDITKKLIAETDAFATSHNTEIKLEPEKDLPKLFGDSEQIELVVENLLDNAIKYIHPVRDIASNGVKGAGRIEIKIAKKDKSIYFEIKDSGIGILKEDQKYIFQKFFRSENAKKTQTQGSGLGLYICKASVEKNGGKIGFKSEENKGSKFWFTLPIK